MTDAFYQPESPFETDEEEDLYLIGAVNGDRLTRKIVSTLIRRSIEDRDAIDNLYTRAEQLYDILRRLEVKLLKEESLLSFRVDNLETTVNLTMMAKSSLSVEKQNE